MNLGGFSWKRAVGLSAAKARLSRRIGIPLTKSGRQRKLGRLISGGGCLVVLAVLVAIPVSLVACLIAVSSMVGLHRNEMNLISPTFCRSESSRIAEVQSSGGIADDRLRQRPRGG